MVSREHWDYDAEYCEVEVFDTPERDNPATGSVSIRLLKGMHGTITRMTASDAAVLRDKITALLEARA